MKVQQPKLGIEVFKSLIKWFLFILVVNNFLWFIICFNRTPTKNQSHQYIVETQDTTPIIRVGGKNVSPRKPTTSRLPKLAYRRVVNVRYSKT